MTKGTNYGRNENGRDKGRERQSTKNELHKALREVDQWKTEVGERW